MVLATRKEDDKGVNHLSADFHFCYHGWWVQLSCTYPLNNILPHGRPPSLPGSGNGRSSIGKSKGKEMPAPVKDFEGVLIGCAFGCLEATLRIVRK